MAKKKKDDPRDLLIKINFYRTFSLIFITMGIFVFCFMYVGSIEGRLFEALRDPFTIGVFLIPFLPAAVLSWLADKLEKRYHKVTARK